MTTQRLNVVQKPSPNFNKGRGGKSVNLLILHSTQGEYNASVGWLRNPQVNNPEAAVSAHYVIKEDGSEIAQLVDEANTAWHCGNFVYNEESIGIEFSWYCQGFNPAAPNIPLPVSDGLYQTGAKLVADLCNQYGIPADRQHIIAHREVPNQTHTDPDGFGKWDWNKFMRLVNENISSGLVPAAPSQPAFNPNPTNQVIPPESAALPLLVKLRRTAATGEITANSEDGVFKLAVIYTDEPGLQIQSVSGDGGKTWQTRAMKDVTPT
jgi:hypothetical protein